MALTRKEWRERLVGRRHRMEVNLALVKDWPPEHLVHAFLASWPLLEFGLCGATSEDESEAAFDVYTSSISRVTFCFERDPAGHHCWISMDMEDLRYVTEGENATVGANMADGLKEVRRLVEKERKKREQRNPAQNQG